MKSVFSICKIFSVCFLVIYSFSSCKSTFTANGVDRPKKVFIYLTVSSTTGNLMLKDSNGESAETIDAWAGQKIKWEVDSKKIKSIEIKPKEGKNGNEAFSDEPHKEFLVQNWKGKIKDEKELKESGVQGEIINYDYDIIWNDKNDKKDTLDPRIQIHTK